MDELLEKMREMWSLRPYDPQKACLASHQSPNNGMHEFERSAIMTTSPVQLPACVLKLPTRSSSPFWEWCAKIDAPQDAACIMTSQNSLQGGLSEEEKRQNVLRLAFGARRERFDEFCRAIRDAIPEGTRVVLRGSAVTGERWHDGAPFDADGSGTSDLDVTLVGDEVVGLFNLTGFFVPGVHSRPLSDEDPAIAPALISLRRQLTAMVGRPVNIQATRDFVMYLRGDLLGQAYLTIIGDPDGS
jgi:hypothetical protein